MDLLKIIHSCKTGDELKQLLTDNKSLIQNYSPLMHERTKNLEHLSFDRIKDMCRAIVVK